jgi:adenylosuccinate lyase
VIPRYTRPEMGALWGDDARYARWLRVELAVCEAWARRGVVPADALDRIRRGARVDAARIAEIEARVHHDVIAFLTDLEASIGTDSRFVHLGLTSSDVVDTALALALVEAADRLITGVDRLRESLRRLALRHRDTLTVGRTHGVHAEPTTFGLKAAGWYAEAGRNRERLVQAREAIRVGKISGAVGTFAHVPPDLEQDVCHVLGLEPEPVSTQVVQRDRHAELVGTCAIVGGSLERIATEIRSLQRTEILEAEEPFREGQKGSSAMPHKRNPWLCEQVTGLARVLRAHAGAALENIALWHERDISHSSVERIVLPDATTLLDYLLGQLVRILDGLRVYPDRMRENLDRSYGLVYSQRVLLALTEAGLGRQPAYEVVQRNAMRAWEERRPFLECLEADPEVSRRLGPEALKACFDPAWYLRHVDAVFRRIGLVQEGPEER